MADTLKYVIVDDDEIDRLLIETEASKFSFFHRIATCNQPLEAFEIITRFRPDIVFADIEMPGMTGLELVRNLSEKIAAPVFITSHPEFALDGYELEAFDYLLKPVTSDRFARCAHRLYDFFQLRNKAFAFENETESNFITIKEGYDKYKIPIHDILFLEAMKDYTKLITSSGHYLVLGTLTGMHSKLPQENFIRIHRSYVVNCSKISAAKGNKLYITTHELPVGKLYKRVVDEMF